MVTLKHFGHKLMFLTFRVLSQLQFVSLGADKGKKLYIGSDRGRITFSPQTNRFKSFFESLFKEVSALYDSHVAAPNVKTNSRAVQPSLMRQVWKPPQIRAFRILLCSKDINQ